MTNYNHLTYEERITIEELLTKNTKIPEIARCLGRDPKTIRDEIRRNRISIYKGALGKGANNCRHRITCKKSAGDACKLCQHIHTKRLCGFCGKCSLQGECSSYEEEVCERMISPPYSCNGCPQNGVCTLKRYRYRAHPAQSLSERRASDSRSGILISFDELQRLNVALSAGIRAGQSPNHILENLKDDLPCSLRTTYTYIDMGLMDVTNLDLPEKVKRHPPRKKREHKVDRHCYEGRSFQDYLNYCEESPHLSIMEMDCVQGLQGEPKSILNLFIPQFHLSITRLLERLTAKQVYEQLHDIRTRLGQELFDRLFAIILTDRGSEFSDPGKIEALGQIRVFYCDPCRSDQKASVERSNREIRRVIPKGYSMQDLEQKDLLRLSSHLNSYSCPSLGNRTAYEMFALCFGEQPLAALEIKKIPPSDIVLTRHLMRGKVMRKDQ